MRYAVMLLLITALCGCETVQPWERGSLSKKEMAWQPDVMESGLQDQMYTSKESSSGGTGAAGGGCGCN